MRSFSDMSNTPIPHAPRSCSTHSWGLAAMFAVNRFKRQVLPKSLWSPPTSIHEMFHRPKELPIRLVPWLVVGMGGSSLSVSEKSCLTNSGHFLKSCSGWFALGGRFLVGFGGLSTETGEGQGRGNLVFVFLTLLGRQKPLNVPILSCKRVAIAPL